MNQAHWHLLLTHLPIVGALAGLGTLLGGFIFRSEPVKRAAMGIFIFSALLAIPTFLTGEGAEEMVEGLPGVNESLIGQHENVATLFVWILGALGLFSSITLVANMRGMKIQQALSVLTLALAIGTVGLSVQLGKTGGEIRHTEIRGATAQLDGGGGENGDPTVSGQEEDDDDN